MDSKYTIGQVAKLFDISTQTLRYYDKINLFKPSYRDPYNKYRYYKKEQFQDLRTILYLKNAGIVLEDIIEYKDIKNIDDLLRILEEQKKEVTEKIKNFKCLETSLSNQIKDIKISMDETIHNKIEFRKIEERYIYLLKSDFRIEDLPDCIHTIIQEISEKKKKFPSLLANQLAISIKKDNLLKDNFERYDYISMFQTDCKYKEIIKKIPKNLFACIYHKGSYENLHKTYKCLIDRLELENYKIIGDSLEIASIDIKLTKNPKEYFTQIQIPIKNKI